ncbi:lysase [Sarracenia purpurea var. burkii]
MSNDIDENLDILVRHALELPLHWRVPRLETRWFIDVYERRSDMKPILLELAKLDFNMIQATHQEELKYLSRWWKNRGLAEKLSFFKDRLTETFLWNIMVDFKPQGSNYRKNVTMVGSLLTVTDDMYDSYGTLDELELFTNAIERWDIAAMEQLPDYMKICFLAIFNTTNEIGYDVLRERSILVIPFLQKMLADLCKSHLVEAKWYNNGYTPSFEEYMNNGWISIAVPLALAVAHIFTNPISKEGLESAEKYSHLIWLASFISRLLDDLETSMDEIKRGDVPTSIQCYMHETGASEEDARQHIKSLIDDTWKELNDVRTTDSLNFDTFIEVTKNMVRSFHCMYQYGDDYSSERGETKDRILSLLINPIPLL